MTAGRARHNAENRVRTVKRNAEIAFLLSHRALQLHKVGRHGRVGVMCRKMAVDLAVDDDMPPGQAPDQLADHLAGGPIPGSPDDGKRPRSVEVAGQPGDIFLSDIVDLDRAAFGRR